MLKESEATASRHLSRIRRELRSAVEHNLRNLRMSDAEIADCFAAVVADSATLDLADLLGPDPQRKEGATDRSKGKERSRAGQR
jgi:hypothetical protein